MKFRNMYDAEDDGYHLEVKNFANGTLGLSINIKDAPRRWRREYITLSAVDAERLAKLITERKWLAKLAQTRSEP